MKILTIIGARPQFIKAAVFSKVVKKYNDIEEVIIHTGQHYDKNMSQIFFDELDIPKPKYNLHINGGSHAQQTGRMLIELEKIFLEEKPNFILVYGDTNSTLAGALAGSKIHIPIIHIEAGFRSHDKEMPEEINRICTDHMSSLLFCPTKEAVNELKKEGITQGVHFVGDIMYDAVKDFSNTQTNILEKYSLEKEKYIYCTIHRAQNTDSKEKLQNIFDALVKSDEQIIIPLHPRTRKKLEEFKLFSKYENKNILFLEPINYFESLELTKNAKKIVTDSGGVLREAYFLQKTCIVVRDSIEFVEMIKDEEGILVGSDKEKIITAIKEFKAKGEFKNYFGNATTAKQIVKVLRR
ncbi:MAG: non-hydrolyzing UDP-N-acetylglucosamine 2-epimerase [Candidatus Woesearchaeota archaeon]